MHKTTKLAHEERGPMFCKRSDQAFNNKERKNAEQQWTEIAEYILPSQSGQFVTNKQTRGEKKTQNIFDSSAIQYNQELASALGATVANPAVKWSSLKFSDEVLNKDDQATAWLEDSNKKMHLAINESNFYREGSKNYKFYTALGNMILLEEEKDLNPDASFGGFQFRAIHLAQIAWSENAEGLVDCIYRKFQLTARQAMEKFDEKVLSDKITTAYEKSPDTEFTFLHCVYPRDKRDIAVGKNGLSPGEKRPYGSVYIDYTSKNIVDEDGYYEFPFFVVRAETAPSEIYGFGPGHVAIPDVRTLNELKKQKLTSTEKSISPPLVASSRAGITKIDQRPSGVTIVDGPIDQAIGELHTVARFDVAQNEIEDLRRSIKSIFYLDKLLLPDRPEVKTEMTAYEIAQRIEQMQRVMGPIINPLQFEYLSPLVLRSFKVMMRAGAFAPLPPALQKLSLDIEVVFINQLARAQRIDDVNSTQTWLNHVGMIAQMDPSVTDVVDGDFLVRNSADILGAPKSALRTEEEIEAIRKQRAEMQQEQMQLENQVKAADIAAKSSKAGGGNNGGQ